MASTRPPTWDTSSDPRTVTNPTTATTRAANTAAVPSPRRQPKAARRLTGGSRAKERKNEISSITSRLRSRTTSQKAMTRAAAPASSRSTSRGGRPRQPRPGLPAGAAGCSIVAAWPGRGAASSSPAGEMGDAGGAMDDVLVKLPGLVAGVVLVAAVATDAVSTLVTTQRRSGRWWPTYVFYRRTWRPWRALAGRVGSEHARERLLAVYGPLSLLGLLVVWVLLLLVGWGLVWWVLSDRLSGVHSYLDALYFAGVGFFTVGFGDV